MEKILIKVYKNRRISKILSLASSVISIVFAAAFLSSVSVMIYNEEYTEAIFFAASALVGYLAVTFVRGLLDAPRPYEIYPFFEILPKNRKGRSFPSRHAYSAFAIATLLFSLCIPLAAALLALAVLLCVCRALLGIHFIRDLVAGAAVGAASGAIGLALM